MHKVCGSNEEGSRSANLGNGNSPNKNTTFKHVFMKYVHAYFDSEKLMHGRFRRDHN